MSAGRSPKVSILMNCYNSSEYLEEALKSVKEQTFQDFEIIFIDNQSTDSSAEIAKNFGTQLKYFKTPQFMSLYSARSFGLQFVQGEYLAFLDCDDIWLPYKLEWQMALFEKTGANFVYGGFKLKFETETWKAFLKTRIVLALNALRRWGKPNSLHSVDKIIRNYDINLQTAIFRFADAKNLIFNPQLNLLGDLDFFYQLGMLPGFLFCYDRKLVAKYRIHEKQLSKARTKNWAIEARYCRLFLYRHRLSEKNLYYFDKLVDFFYGNYLWEKNDFEKSMAIKRKIRFNSSTMFLDWMKYTVRFFFKNI